MNWGKGLKKKGRGIAGCTVAGVLILLPLFVCGCSDGIEDLSLQEIRDFNKLGPEPMRVDESQIVEATHATGPYRVIPDDVLELTMPTILQVVTSESVKDDELIEPLTCRVREDGTIALPVAGDFFVAGRSLSEIERGVVGAYYPKYTQERPTVFARVSEHKRYKVSISGVVAEPGVYELRGDQMSLVALLKEAKGIIIRTQQGGAINGASVIRIERDKIPAPARSPIMPVHLLAPTDLGNAMSLRHGNTKKSVSLATFADSQDRRAGSNRELKLAFRPLKQGCTIGFLSIKSRGRTIVQEKINLASEAQRMALLSRATRVDPTVSMVDLNAKLTSLVSTLYGQPPFDTSLQFASTAANETSGLPDLAAVAADIQKVEQHRDDPADSPEPKKETIVLPMKGMNIPYVDLALQEGDHVIVEQLHMPLFAVLGLVKAPGNYEYPPGEQYNLLQAIAFAGGFNPLLEPRYVTVYRLKADESIARIVFKLKEGTRLTDQLNIPIKPGDVVSVEHTPRTRRNQLLREIINVNIGAYFRPESLWDAD